MPKLSTHYEFEAIGTHWWLERLDGGTFTSDIIAALGEYTAIFDQRYSRFRDDSLVAELARTGVLVNPPAEILTMLDMAQLFSHKTEGAFSLFVGNDLQVLGYGSILPGSADRGLDAYDRDTKLCAWNRQSVTVEPGTVLDFGGMGKGWLIDAYAGILRAQGVRQFIVNGGGDIYCQSQHPTTFALEDPYDSTKKIGDVRLRRGALAASSVIKRAWHKNGKKRHHIVDPHTGKPTESGVVASFVLAQTALVADVLATAVVVRPTLEQKLALDFKVQTRLIWSP